MDICVSFNEISADSDMEIVVHAAKTSLSFFLFWIRLVCCVWQCYREFYLDLTVIAIWFSLQKFGCYCYQFQKNDIDIDERQVNYNVRCYVE